MNRFKGLDLVNRVPEEQWTESIILYRRQGIKPPQSKKRKGTSHHAWKKRVAQTVMIKANTSVKYVTIRQAEGICKPKQVSLVSSFLWKYN